ncbi:restriction endonuclease subunit S [Leuconostoc suionicum]|uniref:restriction endonuclease subunit S n=1 Tax=Leuconostoc suionicum TaxID=1511761 RepID=UPI002954D84C|nr:restriction endonuclease subunit S [Leuconostoc suionicum]
MTDKTMPALRFRGFYDAWEQRKLGEIVEVKSGKDYKQLNKGKIPVYGTGGYMFSVDSALSYHHDAIGIGRKGTIDKPYVLHAPFWTVDTLFYSIPRLDYELDFVNYIFQRINWKQLDESTGVPSLSKSTISNVSVPVSGFDEQKRIGSFFKQLDNLITQNERKIDLLKQLKQAYLQKIFSQKLRFAGFSDAWKECELGEVFDTVTDYVANGSFESLRNNVKSYTTEN